MRSILTFLFLIPAVCLCSGLPRLCTPVPAAVLSQSLSARLSAAVLGRSLSARPSAAATDPPPSAPAKAAPLFSDENGGAQTRLSPSAVGSPQVKNGFLSETGMPQAKNNFLTAVGSPQVKNNFLTTVGSPQVKYGFLSETGMPQAKNNFLSAVGSPQIENSFLTAVGTPQIENSFLTAVGTPRAQTSPSGGRALIAPSAGYVRILEDGVPFYKNPTGAAEDVLFTLFKSYYLPVSQSGEADFFMTELGSGILGFVKKSQVTAVDILPDPVYPELYADSDYTLVLRTRPGADAPAEGYALSGQQLLVYGLFTDGDGVQYAYVDLMGEKFGYVPVERLDLPDIPLHPDPLPAPPEEILPDSSASDSSDEAPAEDPPAIDGTMQLVLVLSILIPSVVVVVLMFRPPKKTPENYSKYY